MPAFRIRYSAPLVLALLAIFTSPATSQSLAASPGENGFEGPVTATGAFWFSAIEDRGILDMGSADSYGPALNLRVDVANEVSVGITSVFLSGDIQGTLVDPYVEYWWTPLGEAHPFYVGTYLGYHFGDYEYKGSNPFFEFPDGSMGKFNDSGFFGGIEGWYPLDEVWSLKGTLSWYPQRSDADFFDSDEMHPIYALGVGASVGGGVQLSVVGAISPLARDGLFVAGASVSF